MTVVEEHSEQMTNPSAVQQIFLRKWIRLIIQKSCIFSILLFFLCLLLLIIATIGWLRDIEILNQDEVCETRLCIQPARTFLHNMNLSIDPCDDFYGYSCGGYQTRKRIRLEDFYASAWNDLQMEADLNLKYLLNRRPIDQTEPLQSVQTYFQSCLNVSQINSLSITPLLNELKNSMIDESIISHSSNWTKIEDFERFWNHWILQGLPNPLLSSTSRNELHSLSIYPAYWDDKEVFDKGKLLAIQEISNVMSLLKTEWPSMSNIEEDAYEVMKDLVQTFPKSENVGDYVEAIPIEKLDSLCPQMNITPTLKSWYEAYGEEVNISRQLLLEESPTYFFKFCDGFYEQWFTGNSSTRLNKLVGYFIYKLIQTRIPLLGDTFLSDELTDTRVEYCLDDVQKRASFLIGAAYLQGNNSTETTEQIMRVSNIILHTMGEVLNKSKWLDDETRDEALKKLMAIEYDVGGYADFKNDDLIQRALFNVSLSSYYDNALAADRRRNELFAKSQKLTMIPYDVRPNSVQAFYIQVFNRFVINEALADLPVFHAEYPLGLQISSLGSVVGHEIGHAFVENGRSYDAKGKESYWWTNETTAHYLERVQCFLNQIKSFPLQNLVTNASDYISEVFADDISETLSYTAWQNIHKKEKIPRLPGIRLTEEQLMFVAKAQIWCERVKENHHHTVWNDQTHPPKPLRVLLKSQNSKAFAKAFHCSKNSKMNPDVKCKIFDVPDDL